MYVVCSHQALMLCVRWLSQVLIHAGTGGVGLAAVQAWTSAGAAVAATAGSPAKRTFLRRSGVPTVAGSRDAAFVDIVGCSAQGGKTTMRL